MQRLFTLVPAIRHAADFYLGQDIVSSQKNDNTPVTNIDLGIQEAIIGIILHHYPQDGIIAEETGGEGGRMTTRFNWVIDPIDGTENFIQGKKEFGISVGLLEGQKFVEAFVFFPALDEQYYAARDMGVWCNGQPFRVPLTDTESIQNDIVLCSRAKARWESSCLKKGYRVLFYRCATYGLLQVLKRKAWYYLSIDTKIYDVGPMAFIVAESGGHVSDREGAEMIFDPVTPEIPFIVTALTKEKRLL